MLQGDNMIDARTGDMSFCTESNKFVSRGVASWREVEAFQRMDGAWRARGDKFPRSSRSSAQSRRVIQLLFLHFYLSLKTSTFPFFFFIDNNPNVRQFSTFLILILILLFSCFVAELIKRKPSDHEFGSRII